MKVLIIYPLDVNNLKWNQVSDYQMDCVFHGFRSLLGEDVVDSQRLYWMYKKDRCEQTNQIWGKGFTLYHQLDECEIDRSDIACKICEKFFDLIIIPRHHTIYQNHSIIYTILDQLSKYGYQKNQIVFIDGHDFSEVDKKICKYATYFKRELYSVGDYMAGYCHPINFAIPEDKIVQGTCSRTNTGKTEAFASLVPVNQSINPEYMKTYTFDNEEDYYRMYQNSFFGFTSKKGGWATMRHLEILANGCIPFFVDIEHCPAMTLHNFPKGIFRAVKKMPGVYPNLNNGIWDPEKPELKNCDGISMNSPGFIDFDKFNMVQYLEYRDRLLQHTRSHLTTTSLAKDIISVCSR